MMSVRSLYNELRLKSCQNARQLSYIFCTSLFLTVFICAEAQAINKCSEIFKPNRIDASQKLIEKMDLADWTFSSDIQIESNSQSSELNKINFFALKNETTEVRHEVNVAFFSAGQSIKPEKLNSNTAYARFLKLKSDALSFVIDDAYPNRRGHWSGDFRTYLHKVADHYERESTYINLSKTQKSGGKQKLEASIRLIVEKDGLTPMEDYLNIRLKNEQGFLKVEPGNFAIDPSANEISWMEIGAHLISQMRRYEEQYQRDAIFVTYADAFSQRLYKKLGFEFLRADSIEIADPGSVRIDKNGRTFFFKDGVDWAPMAISRKNLERQMRVKILDPSSNMLAASLKAHESGLTISPSNSFDIFRLQQSLFNLSGIARMGTLPNLRVFYGEVTNSEGVEPLRLLIGDRADGKSELFLQIEDKRQIGWFRSGFTLPLPRVLREGWSGSFEGLLGKMKMHYSNGVLSIKQNLKDENYLIYINPEMTNASNVTFHSVGLNSTQKKFSLRRQIDIAKPTLSSAHPDL